jgi:hypothetical protein
MSHVPTVATPSPTRAVTQRRGPTRRAAVARRLLAATAAAGLALLVAAGPVLAVTWTGSDRISALDVFRPTTLRTGASSAVVIWQRGSTVYQRRTVDDGATWLARTTLATGVGPGVSVAGSGAAVHIAYTKRVVCSSSGAIAWRLMVRRSTDGGAGWRTARALTSGCAGASDQAVARHANGQVSVAWTTYATGAIRVRTSNDGGATFGAAVTAARATDREPGGQPFYRGNVALGIGSRGTTYLAYANARDELSIRRSRDAGRTWSAATRIAAHASAEEVEILARGASAIVAYTRSANGRAEAVYRRTTDRGTTWSSARLAVGLTSGEFSTRPRLAHQAGVLALEVKAGPPGDSPVWYRESRDFGVTWTARSRVSVDHGTGPDPEAGGVALLDGVVLVTWYDNSGTDDQGLWVRLGTP